MQKIAPGLWHWEASHPEWELSEPWAQDVSSYAIEDGGRLLLFDPLDLPAELEELAAERETAIVLTAPWHERDTRSLMETLGLPVYTPPVDTAQDLIDKFGITAEQAGDGSPDLRWLRERGDGNFYLRSDELPFEIEVFPGREHNDVVLWVESKRAVISGDTLADFGQGLGDPGRVAPQRRDARGGRRRPAPASRSTGRARPRSSRRRLRAVRPRARTQRRKLTARLTLVPIRRSARACGRCETTIPRGPREAVARTAPTEQLARRIRSRASTSLIPVTAGTMQAVSQEYASMAPSGDHDGRE